MEYLKKVKGKEHEGKEWEIEGGDKDKINMSSNIALKFKKLFYILYLIWSPHQ